MRRAASSRSSRQWQRDPASLAKRSLDRVDHFLDPRAVAEVAFVGVLAAEDFADEAVDQVGVEQRPPRFAARPAGWIAARRYLDLAELDLIRCRRAQRLAD